MRGLLLIGPTGAGKTPLGDWLQTHGLAGRRCHHFDFGAHLRAIASGHDRSFSAEEVRSITDVVTNGALLENEALPLALRIFDNFVSSRAADEADLAVMNGFPRHASQAQGIAGRIDIRAVAELRCPAETVLERLRLNTGGDRAARTDDDLELVRRKLAIYSGRTAPLLRYYQERGIITIPVPVSASTGPASVAEVLEEMTLELWGGRSQR